MIVSINDSRMSNKTFEARANKMREIWGENTVVWWSRGWINRVYGHDAEVMEQYCNLPTDWDNELLQLSGQFTINQEDIYRPKLVKAGYKIVWLSE